MPAETAELQSAALRHDADTVVNLTVYVAALVLMVALAYGLTARTRGRFWGAAALTGLVLTLLLGDSVATFAHGLLAGLGGIPEQASADPQAFVRGRVEYHEAGLRRVPFLVAGWLTVGGLAGATALLFRMRPRLSGACAAVAVACAATLALDLASAARTAALLTELAEVTETNG